jgi:hypothetical protein
MEGDRCRDLQPSFPAYAAGLTDGLLNERIHLHLGDGCPACAIEIEELMEAFHAVPLGLAVEPFAAERAEALVALAKTQRQEEVETPILFPETNQLRLWMVLTALAAVAVVAAAIWGGAQAKEAERLRIEAARAAQQSGVAVDSSAELRAQLQGIARTLESAADPLAKVIDLKGEMPGRAFIDAEGNTLVLSLDPLGSPGAGRLHHVWLLEASDPALISTLPPGYSVEGGQVALRLSEGVGEDASVLITLESAASTPTEPGGKVVLRSKK